MRFTLQRGQGVVTGQLWLTKPGEGWFRIGITSNNFMTFYAPSSEIQPMQPHTGKDLIVVYDMESMVPQAWDVLEELPEDFDV